MNGENSKAAEPERIDRGESEPASKAAEEIRRRSETEPAELWGKRMRESESGAGALPYEAESAVALALVLHELGTNTRKYGAPSVPAGSVLIAWSRDGRAGTPVRVDRERRPGGVGAGRSRVWDDADREKPARCRRLGRACF